ncbi:hypothetical protein PS619_06282 [Pseudomonas fluorescens]|nr:hypothetical protein PS619_06282 [Pseudomonas fluorescens]
MARPMRRASMRRAMRPLCARDGRNHASGLKTTSRIDTTNQTVISLFPILGERIVSLWNQCA